MATGKAAAKKLSKTQLTAELAEATGTNKKVAGQFVDTLTEIAYRETKKNGEFTVPGIGKLVKAHRKARTGRNPQTGATIKIAARRVAKFTPGAELKKAVNKGK